MKITIVGMIYKSVVYLNFMIDQLKKYGISNKHQVEFLIIANDANEKVLEYLKQSGINHLVYNDPDPLDYYLNRVYRAWNFGGRNASGDIVVFVNSDMAYSLNWLDKLVDRLNPQTLPCSRLIESGKLLSGQYAISCNFGQTSQSYYEDGFIKYCESIAKPEIQLGGLYMPCAFFKTDFVKSGGYPEGNIYEDGAGTLHGRVIESGDSYFFKRMNEIHGLKHITVFDSLVYHIQEGELDE